MFRFRRQVYLDNNATTMVSPEVRKQINRVLKNNFGNPSSLYRTARNSAMILENSREMLAQVIHASAEEIYFCGCASEANNTVIKSLAEHFYPDKKKIITTQIEHSSVLKPLEYLADKGFSIQFCPVDRFGRVDINGLAKMIDNDTFLICCMLANNEIGTIQDIAKITNLAHANGILALCDCVQALGKIKVDVTEMGMDYATFSAHKIHGPKGIGALYVKQGVPISPLIHGGHQEQGLRAGTEGLHNIAGFAVALKNVDWLLHQEKKLLDLKKFFIAEIKKIKDDIIVNSPPENCLPNTISIRFPGINNAMLMSMLDYYGISVSAGSACNTQEDAPSHVLKAIGLLPEETRETIRFSFSAWTSQKSIKYALDVICDYITEKKSEAMSISPAQFDEDMVFNKNNFIFDIRWPIERKLTKALPNSYEGSFINFQKYLPVLPKDKRIIVICQSGYSAPIVAYYLAKKGFRDVSFVFGGLVMWKIAYPELYKAKAGQNKQKLTLPIH